MVRSFQPSRYIRARFLRVALYNIHISAQQRCFSSDDDSISSFLMKWESFLEVWHETIAQLLADGVPPQGLPAKEVSRIVNIWDNYRKRIKD